MNNQEHTVMRMERAHHLLMEYHRLLRVREYNRSGANPSTKNIKDIVVRNIERKINAIIDQFPTVQEWHEINSKPPAKEP